jgi:hypothetical protein
MVRLTRGSKALLGLYLVVALGWAGVAYGQATTKTHTGIIKEIGKALTLKGENFYSFRLEEYPKTEFRISAPDAVRYGLIETAGTTGVITPKMSKGVGWKVKVTTEKSYEGTSSNPSYRVLAVERLDG